MSKLLKPIVASVFVFVLSFVVAQVVAQPAYAQDVATDQQNALCGGASQLKINPTEGCNDTDISGSAEKLNVLIKNIINIFSVVVGIVAVIMIIVGGFRYITSGGDSGNVTGAKNTILYAIVGLVIVALAQFIVKFVLNKSTALTT
jgi:vacuolar-type H+-ATPase subunit I/STV1